MRRRSSWGAGARGMEQAGVAEGVEAVTGRNRVGVGSLHGLEAAEGGDEHEEGRARQVEVGEQEVDGAESIARGDEDVGLAAEGVDQPLFICSAFEKAQGRAADGDDATASCARPV